MADAPERAPSHPSLDNATMARLGQIVEKAAENRPIGCNAIEALAREHGVPASHLFASAASTTTVEFAREYKTAFVVCGGGCQEHGSLELLEHLVETRRPRLKAWFKKAFDIEARGCLNRCEQSPVVRIHTKDGVAYLERTTKDDLTEAVKFTCR